MVQLHRSIRDQRSTVGTLQPAIYFLRNQSAVARADDGGGRSRISIQARGLSCRSSVASRYDHCDWIEFIEDIRQELLRQRAKMQLASYILPVIDLATLPIAA